ncbi:hypothetical protein CFI10_04400 [Marinobacterium iners]|nr:hypothetical protein CFI10_04400 [Marinobacterium iners]
MAFSFPVASASGSYALLKLNPERAQAGEHDQKPESDSATDCRLISQWPALRHPASSGEHAGVETAGCA